jgi:hypothetical protein
VRAAIVPGQWYNELMVDVPQQDWELYRQLTRDADVALLRSLSLADRSGLYLDLFKIHWAARRGPGDWQRVEQRCWQEKLETRQRLVNAFTKLDVLERERAACHRTG